MEKSAVESLETTRDGSDKPVLDRRRFLRGSVLAAGLLATSGGMLKTAQAAAPGVVKFACVAPEGSIWVNLTRDWNRELVSLSQNRARIQIYSGGVLGEEVDAIRKMRAGQIHATGVTGVGMGEMLSATRVLELPRLFRTTQELDAVTSRLESDFARRFAERGFTFLGFTEVGPIHLLTRKPLTKVTDLNATRMWVFEGDPLSDEIAKAYKLTGVRLPLLNVLPSLQTGVIDGVYGSPLGVMTMQWHTYLKYLVADPLSFGLGAIAMDRKFFEAQPADIQKLHLELGRKYTRQMVLRSREDNDKSLALLKSRGVQVTTLPEAEKVVLENQAKQVWTNLQGKLFPPELLASIQAVLQEVRSGKK